MKFEDSVFFNVFENHKLEMPFGNYYLCEKFIVAELFEGTHFDWPKAEKLINELLNFYHEDAKIGFISNRINQYSVDPQNWVKLEKNYTLIVASAIIMYNNLTLMNASIEKQFAKQSIKRCTNLKEAIDWMLQLDELR